MRPKTLQQRLAFFILAPVALLLLAMGWAGLMFAKHSILSQWSEASTLKLQRAAHFVDMQLKRPKQLLGMLQFVGDGPHGDDVRLFLLQRMEAAEGVSRVVLDLDGVARDISELRRLPPHHAMMAGNGMSNNIHIAVGDSGIPNGGRRVRPGRGEWCEPGNSMPFLPVGCVLSLRKDPFR